jgi:hypothetical protein
MDVQKYATDNASEKGAVDRFPKLLDAVKEADIVFLAIPAHEVEDTLELMVMSLRKMPRFWILPDKIGCDQLGEKIDDQPDIFWEYIRRSIRLTLRTIE